ncbi:hypothetical protein BE20_15115 [Sorangium cellulosum]|nr:hypothetical protein BE20_15115 [Sorangium cellulosum]
MISSALTDTPFVPAARFVSEVKTYAPSSKLALKKTVARSPAGTLIELARSLPMIVRSSTL